MSACDSTAPRGAGLLATGRDCDVYRLGAHTVIRRYRAGGQDVALEARVMRHLHERGYPVPYVEGWDDRNLVMEYVPGRSMYEELRERPQQIAGQMTTLAGLHRRLHAIAAPEWLPTERNGEPWQSPSVEGQRVVLHLDLHPHNVILGPQGPVVIDWSNVCAGPAGRDVAQTWLLLATTTQLPDGRRAVSGAGRAVAQRFLAMAGRTEALPHIVPLASARLANANITESERHVITALLKTTTVHRPRAVPLHETG